jgi:hypothetical protein
MINRTLSHATSGRVQRDSRVDFKWLDASGQWWPDAPVCVAHLLSSHALARLTSPYVSANRTWTLRVRSRHHATVANSDWTRRSQRSVALWPSRPAARTSAKKWPDSAGQRLVRTWPASGRCAALPFLFLSPQPLRACFQLAKHKVYNLCAHVLAFLKHFTRVDVSSH